MESAVNNGMCRCCASEGTFKDVKTTYHWMGEEEIYSDMLKECFDISLLLSEDGDDGGICEVCITQLRNAANFKKQVQHTEDQFKQRLQNKSYKCDIVKIEPTKEDDEENESDNNMSEDNFSTAEYEVPIKTEELLEELNPKKRPAATKPTTSRAKKIKVDDGETSSKRIGKDNTTKMKNYIANIQNYITFVQKRNTQRVLKNPIEHQVNTKHRAHTEEIQIKTKHIDDKKGEISTKISSQDKFQIVKEAKDEIKERNKNSSIGKSINNREISKHKVNTIKTLLNFSNATPIRLYCDGGYKCCFCEDNYPNPADLKVHTISTHNDATKAYFMKNSLTEFLVKMDITDLQCNLCGEDIDSIEVLYDHLSKQHNKFISKEIVSLIIPFKFNSETLQCCICFTAYNTFRSLFDHMKIHYRNHVCDVCDASFFNKQQFHLHIARGHETGSFKCNTCEKVFDTLPKKNSHERSVHVRGQFLHKCGICGEMFNRYRLKQVHLTNTHGVKPVTHECNICKKIFATSVGVRKHTRRVHLMEREQKCTLCDMQFCSKNELVDHMISHTGKRDLKCDVCNKSYPRRKALREHMRIHLNDRRYKCEFCEQTFIQNCSLKAHLRSKHKELVSNE